MIMMPGKGDGHLPQRHVDDVWRRYLADRGQVALRDWLVARYVYLADNAVARARKRVPPAADVDAMASAAYAAVLWCVERYRPDLHCGFASYAHRRIHGAIGDEIRIQSGCRRKPRPSVGSLFSPAASVGEDNPDGEPLRVIDVLAAPPIAGDSAEEDARRAAGAELGRLARGMPMVEQVVLYLRYVSGAKFKAIGRVMGFSEGRASQIHGQALERLRRMHGCCEVLRTT
jgi:RNA polymerase sigma factor for flagellar operon FliA